LLAHPLSAGEEGLCFAVVLLFKNISVISVKPIISTSTGPIFTKLTGLVDPVATNFVGKINLLVVRVTIARAAPPAYKKGTGKQT